ncbi:Ubiquitin-conjugating_enzyme E2 [Hexamita inflata]|uniref:Ubiquitin-conjugating enzyme E2 n=1 Tax=Hexamita inflata TaxID=28002 RepID=A0AA86QWR7_9EUKA|nr:Ubiquitin-conjugating enzyme E2 [Hexamita inflata]
MSKKMQIQIRDLIHNYPVFNQSTSKDGSTYFETYFFAFEDKNSPFNCKMIKAVITLTNAFPHKSPSIGVAPNSIWHPNVDFDSGSVCVNLLNSQWNDKMELKSILELILPTLLENPGTKDPLNAIAAKQYDQRRQTFNQEVNQRYKPVSDAEFKNNVNVKISDAFRVQYDKYILVRDQKQTVQPVTEPVRPIMIESDESEYEEQFEGEEEVESDDSINADLAVHHMLQDIGQHINLENAGLDMINMLQNVIENQLGLMQNQRPQRPNQRPQIRLPQPIQRVERNENVHVVVHFEEEIYNEVLHENYPAQNLYNEIAEIVPKTDLGFQLRVGAKNGPLLESDQRPLRHLNQQNLNLFLEFRERERNAFWFVFEEEKFPFQSTYAKDDKVIALFRKNAVVRELDLGATDVYRFFLIDKVKADFYEEKGQIHQLFDSAHQINALDTLKEQNAFYVYAEVVHMPEFQFDKFVKHNPNQFRYITVQTKTHSFKIPVSKETRNSEIKQYFRIQQLVGLVNGNNKVRIPDNCCLYDAFDISVLILE